MTDDMRTEEMRAVVVSRHGGADVLEVRQVAVPRPGPGQVLIRVGASGVNFIDVYRREGRYPGETPFVLGEECAGEVVEVGPDVSDIEVGAVVAAAHGTSGGHAEYAVIDALRAVPVPDGVSCEVAAAAMLQGMTAHYLVRSTFPLEAGQDVLVHAGAGGVGQLLIQLARTIGARVITTVGSAEKEEIARAAGAEHVLRYDRLTEAADLAGAVREIAPDGVHVVYDGVGASTFEGSLASLGRRGMLVLFGAASGPVPPFDLQRLNPAGSLFVTRPTLADYIATRAELLRRAGDVLAAVADGSLRVDIGGRYPFEDARRAYDDLEGRRTRGKLLLVP